MKLIQKRELLTSKPFTLEELTFAEGAEFAPHPYYRLSAPDWVNILPILPDGRALLIKQFRVGTLSPILEVPGGMVDSGEKDPTMAAIRELEEETGYYSQKILPIGVLNPNPAIMTNKTHFFLALEATPHPARSRFQDPGEKIETIFVPAKELAHMVRTAQINHALAALCIMLSAKYLDIGA